MKDNLLAQAKAVMEDQNRLLDLLEAKRVEQVTISGAAELSKDKMMQVHRDKTLLYSQFPEISGAIDPKTGKSNKDWSQLLLDQKLENDEEYVAALGEMYRFNTELAELNNDVLNIVERLNVTKTQARLLAAMLEVVKDT
jgi:hypothetical protein